jgi:3-oxoacyl-[acyl-carrier protein] reductase
MTKTRFDFTGQVVVLTGAARGIGRGAAEAFSAAGARVYVIDVDATAGDELAHALREDGHQAAFVAADLTVAAQVTRAFERVVAEAGRLDVLVNCAGGFTRVYTVEDTPEEEWDRVVALNLKTTFLCARAAIPTFKRQRSGRIVSLGSIAGVSPWPPTSPAYAAAKAGVHNLTRSLAVELGPHGVGVNAIAPGTTASERVVALRGRAGLEEIARAAPLGKIAEIEDMVGWILFLAAPESAHLTGQTISVNGGRYMS